MNDKPFIKDIVYVAPQKNWSFPLHSHESSAELSLVMNGKGVFYALNKEYVIRRGMLVIKNAGISHSEKSDPEDPLEQICVEAGGINTEGLGENCILPGYMSPVMELGEEYDMMRAAFVYMMNNYMDASAGGICEKILETVLLLVQKRVMAYVPAPERKPHGKKELVSETLNYLDMHYREKLRIRDLAAMFYTSEGNLSRQFKAVTGYTINEYIISKRMGEAQRMLIYEAEDIREIAMNCGYEDLQYFYHVFKSCAHCTPAEFREKYRRLNMDGSIIRSVFCNYI